LHREGRKEKEVGNLDGRKMEMKWGDAVAEGGDELEKDFQYQTYETPLNEDGVKTRFEYTTNEDGDRVKIIRKIQVKDVVTKVHRDVEKRRHMQKFGECAGKPPGPEAGITMIGDEVFLESSLTKKDDVVDKDTVSMGIQCRHCGAVGDHWTLKCPYKDRLQAAQGMPLTEQTMDDSPYASGSGSRGGSKYVPPSLRNKSEGGSNTERSLRQSRSDDPTVRVTNISEDTKEEDLHDLFSQYGDLKRVYLAKDKHTGLSKGFAFVTYMRVEQAQKAVENLCGVGFNHLILHVEWAKN